MLPAATYNRFNHPHRIAGGDLHGFIDILLYMWYILFKRVNNSFIFTEHQKGDFIWKTL